MLRPISPELVLFLDFWVSNIPRYFCFALQNMQSTIDLEYITFYFEPRALIYLA